MRKRSITSIALLVSSCAAIAAATTFAPLALDDLAQQADCVAVVRVGAAASRVDNGRIVTDIQLDSAEFVTGGGESRSIRLTLPGGRHGGKIAFVPGSPIAEFTPGARLLVFLVTDGEKFGLLGLARGAYRVDARAPSGAAPRIIDTPASAAPRLTPAVDWAYPLVPLAPGPAVTARATRLDAMPLRDLIDRVRAARFKAE